ncbi:hypothetical protein [Moraxella lincolnii]|uniref:Histidine kinase BarA N-terminal domain-containing protein n=1 Tax=Lwoffella lincolnii TaxID=90241 RepID=A0A1T0CD92_9GAMM|nr:hypothetical protein [Moraxella lincolnii]OOS20249.1 hypothetical protein B0682_07630 [Moraxella lincolnii]
MTYTAPRQGLFAIIILISFILHSVLMVFSLEQQLNANREHKAKQLISELAETTGVALYQDDRVSLSVIADHLGNDIDVTRLTLLDNAGNILVQTGNAPLQAGTTHHKPVLLQNNKVGDVELTIKRTSKGEMVKTLWPFELGALIVHLLIWLLYGHIARPTKGQLQRLSRDIHDYYVLHYDMANNDMANNQQHGGVHFSYDDRHDRHDDTPNTDNNTASLSVDESSQPATSQPDHGHVYDDVSSQVSRFLKRGQFKPNTQKDTDQNSPPTDNPVANKAQPSSWQDSTKHQTHQQNLVNPNGAKQTRHIPTNTDTPIVVAFMFADEHRLLSKLSPQIAQPYLTLCNDLLQTASLELLRQPSFQGVQLQSLEHFAINHPARITLNVKQGFDNANSKLAQASVMLAMLCMMLNKIIFDRHRELKRFALPINATIAHTEQSDGIVHLLKGRFQEHQTYVLLPTQELTQIQQRIQLTQLNNPKSVYERECRRIIGADDDTINRLTSLRNDIMLTV